MDRGAVGGNSREFEWDGGRLGTKAEMRMTQRGGEKRRKWDDGG